MHCAVSCCTLLCAHGEEWYCCSVVQIVLYSVRVRTAAAGQLGLPTLLLRAPLRDVSPGSTRSLATSITPFAITSIVQQCREKRHTREDSSGDTATRRQQVSAPLLAYRPVLTAASCSPPRCHLSCSSHLAVLALLLSLCCSLAASLLLCSFCSRQHTQAAFATCFAARCHCCCAACCCLLQSMYGQQKMTRVMKVQPLQARDCCLHVSGVVCAVATVLTRALPSSVLLLLPALFRLHPCHLRQLDQTRTQTTRLSPSLTQCTYKQQDVLS